MRRIRIVGLCAGAVLALAGLSASSAYAGEYGECVKAPKTGMRWSGTYLDNACRMPASPAQIAEAKLNRYDWQGVQPVDRPFSEKTASVGLEWAAGELVCKGSSGSGEVLGWQRNSERITFEGCYLGRGHDAENCWSEGFPATSTTIAGSALDSYLIDHGTAGPDGAEPREGEVWNELESSEGRPYLTEFECASGSAFRVSGTLSGVSGSVQMKIKGKLAFARGSGEQELTTESSMDHGASWGPPEASTLTGAINIQYRSKVEVRPCNEPGARSEGVGALNCENEELPLPWGPLS